MSNGEPTVEEEQDADASYFLVQPVQIDWRKLVSFFFLAMVLPTVVALVLDWWLSFFPYITIAVISVCFPLATIMGMRMTLKEINRVIDEVAPPSEESDSIELDLPETAQEDVIEVAMAPEGIAEAEIKAESSSKP